ncbi:hypothetical protein [Saccharothrix sp. HUAS TT1]
MINLLCALLHRARTGRWCRHDGWRHRPLDLGLWQALRCTGCGRIERR